MGITKVTADFLAEAARGGVVFDRTGTLGRQHLMVGPWGLIRVLREAGIAVDVDAFYRQLDATRWYADPFFRALGAHTVTAIDASDYEGAEVITDLNEPVSQELHQSFSVVFDGGSLEHIFHVTTALRNAMEMVRVGGHLLMTAPGNNTFGHGLFQFGPDFFHRALSPENGFRIERALILEHDADAPGRFLGKRIAVEKARARHEMADPAEIGERVQLVNRRPVLILIQARRVSHASIFALSPQQSDYSARWTDHGLRRRGASRAQMQLTATAERLLGTRAQLHLMLDVIPRLVPLIDPLRGMRERRRRSLANPRYFPREQANKGFDQAYVGASGDRSSRPKDDVVSR